MHRVVGFVIVAVLAMSFALQSVAQPSPFSQPQSFEQSIGALLRATVPRFARPPTIHLLAVGISRYADPSLPRLSSPASDARFLASIISSMGDRANIATVTQLTDAEATRSSIIKEYVSIVSRAKPDDLIIFFWTGVSDKDNVNSLLTFFLYDYDRAHQRSEDGLDLKRDLLSITPADQKLLIIADGCNIGDGTLGSLLDQHPNVAILASTKSDELARDGMDSTPFVSALAEVLKSTKTDLDGDGLLSVEELYVQLYGKMVRPVPVPVAQHPSLGGLRSHRLIIATAISAIDTPETSLASRVEVAISSVSPTESHLLVNGKLMPSEGYSISSHSVAFLGPAVDAINPGPNFLEIGRQKFLLWRIGRSLKAFRDPYKRSRAIIMAIDDYDRTNDPLKRGPTGFAALTGMVDRAKELKSTLVALGFAEPDIIELYNADATAQRLEDNLKSFWVGGSNAETDRLLVYFGGHGDDFQNSNLLVTYDYEPAKRLLTSFQTKDLVERHSRNIQANHVMFAVDVCYSGLVFLGDDAKTEPTQQDIEENTRLAIIERNVTGRARDIIVAGTGDQRALWMNGGIFTTALIEGLRGKGDPSNTGVIQFDQLGIYVKDRVTTVARFSGFKQVPKFVPLDDFGDGRVMFIRPPASSQK